MADYRARVVIPTTASNAETIVTEIKESASNEFGGYSEYDGAGGWVSPDNELIEESHTVIEVVTTEDKSQLQSWLQSTADTVKAELDETTVLAVIEEVTAQFL